MPAMLTNYANTECQDRYAVTCVASSKEKIVEGRQARCNNVACTVCMLSLNVSSAWANDAGDKARSHVAITRAICSVLQKSSPSLALPASSHTRPKSDLLAPTCKLPKRQHQNRPLLHHTPAIHY